MPARRGLLRGAVAVAAMLVIAFQSSGALAQTGASLRAYQNLPVTPGTWKQLDPAPLNTNGTDPEPLATGRVLSLAYGGGVLFAGAAGGGVWTSPDGGQTWTPRTDSQLGSLVVGALAVSPSNPKIVYAGTGDEGQLDQTGDG